MQFLILFILKLVFAILYKPLNIYKLLKNCVRDIFFVFFELLSNFAIQNLFSIHLYQELLIKMIKIKMIQPKKLVYNRKHYIIYLEH